MLVLGEEEHPHPVLTLAADGDVQLVGDLGEKFVADLQQDAHAVAGPALGVLAGAVLQMLDDGQRVADRLVALAAVDIHHRADAAGVVLEPGVIQAGGGCAFVPTIHSYPILSLSQVCKKQKAPLAGAAACQERHCSLAFYYTVYAILFK